MIKQHLPLTRALGSVIRLLLLINSKWRTGIKYSRSGFKFCVCLLPLTASSPHRVSVRSPHQVRTEAHFVPVKSFSYEFPDYLK